MLRELKLNLIIQPKICQQKVKSNYILDSYNKFTSPNKNNYKGIIGNNPLFYNNPNSSRILGRNNNLIRTPFKTYNNSVINLNNPILSQRNLKSKRPKTSRNNKNESYSHRRTNSLQDIRKKNINYYCHSIQSNDIPDDYRENFWNYIDNDFNDLKTMITSIKENGFEKYQNEIEKKTKLKNELEMSIFNLKSIINNFKNNKKNLILENSKNTIEIKNIENMNLRYKDINDNIEQYKKDISILNTKVNKLNNKNLNINLQIVKYKSDIEIMKQQNQKYNKIISDLKKQKDNIKSAIKILYNHIENIKEKMRVINIGKSDFMINFSNMTERSIVK